MGQKQSHPKPGTGMTPTTLPPSIPSEQPSVSTVSSAYDQRALHSDGSSTRSPFILQKETKAEERGFHIPTKIKDVSANSEVSGVSAGVGADVFGCSLDRYDSDRSPRTEKRHSKDENEPTSRASFGRSWTRSSTTSSTLIPSREESQLNNDHRKEKYQVDTEVVPEESSYPNPLAREREPGFEVLHTGEGTALRIHSRRVIQALIKHTTDYAGSQYEELRPTPSSLRLDEPYELLFCNREELRSLACAGEHACQHSKGLLDFMREKRSRSWDKLDEIEQGACTKTAFKDVWLLYPPRTTVFKRDVGGWRAYKVRTVEIPTHVELGPLQIHGCYLDYDSTGQFLVPQLEVLSIAPYASERSISSLEVVPEAFIGHIHNNLIKRGRIYWSYRGQPAYREYRGDAWPNMPYSDPVRVVVDYATASRHERDTNRTCPRVHSSFCLDCCGEALGLGSYLHKAPHDPDVCTRRVTAATHKNIDDQLLLFCPSRLWAFSLRHKTWEMVEPQHLRNMEQEDGALDKLWMDGQHKKSLVAMVCSHYSKGGKSSADIIPGKGRGVNILLHGAPGTGKTLTAECLAEKFGVPLYTVTCGDMGTDPDILERRLHETFLRAANWKAILLLDEADVFVTKRDSEDLKRNALVSLFLRHLEYSEGLLVMTTNRPRALDPALESRIHLPLQLPNFTLQAQKDLWLKFINNLKDLSSTEKLALDDFINNKLEKLDGAYIKMNGRQIRNCMTAALALAQGDRNSSNGKLEPHHIETMLKLGKEFREYMDRITSVFVRKPAST